MSDVLLTKLVDHPVAGKSLRVVARTDTGTHGFEVGADPDGGFFLFVHDTATGYSRAVYRLTFTDFFEMVGRYARKWEEEGKETINPNRPE